MRRVVQHRLLRRLVLAGTIFAPQPVKRLAYRRLLGWSVASTAYIGWSWIEAERVEIGPYARIGHFSVILNLTELVLSERSSLGALNWASAASMFLTADVAAGRSAFRGLRLGPDSAITSRHHIDCSGGVNVGHHTVIGGHDSTILTHQIDFSSSQQTTSGVRVGDYCFVGSNVNIAPGAIIADRVVVAMGATVVGHLAENGASYGGVPARVIKRNIDGGAYFTRRYGFVGPAPISLTKEPHVPRAKPGAAGSVGEVASYDPTTLG